jgi:hypothetical protein
MKKLVIVTLLALSACKTIEKQGVGFVYGQDGVQTNNLIVMQIAGDDITTSAVDKQTGESFKGQFKHNQAEVCPDFTDIMLTSAIGAAMKDDKFIDENSNCEIAYTGKSDLVLSGNMGSTIQCIFQSEEYSHFPENGRGTCVYQDGRQISLEAKNFRDIEVEM